MLLGITTNDLIPANHPIRAIKQLTDRVLTALSMTFAAMYAGAGRHSVPPEHLLKASLLMALYTIRSERQFCERLQYDLLFKWFLDLNIADAAFDHSTFSKNRERLLTHQVAERFFAEVVGEARQRDLLSDDHFTVDGTLLEAWASVKSFRPRDGSGTPPTGGAKNPEVDFHGEKRSNATHASTTDPEARLAKKGAGKEAKLSFLGHVLMENRNGLVADLALTLATGTAEREAALELLGALPEGGQVTVGADKLYDVADFVVACRAMEVTPHVAQKKKYSAIDGRTTRHPGYAVSQVIRKRVEEIFGWVKTVGGGRKLRYIGLRKNRFWWTLTASMYNIVRMTRLAATAQQAVQVAQAA
jgi:transposase